MIKCVIVEDEPRAKDVLSRYIDMLNDVELIGYCRDGIEAIDLIPKLKPNLIFLDINMPNLNGLELLNLLKVQPKVIITTAYNEYALKSYDFDVLDYLLKPIEFDKFLRAINRFKELSSSLKIKKGEINFIQDYTLIKSGSKTHKVKLNEIIFLKKEGNYIEIFTENEKVILIRSNMNDIFKLIPEESFARVHKSYVVPLNKIDVIEVNKLIIKKHEIPLGSTYRFSLNERLKKNRL